MYIRFDETTVTSKHLGEVIAADFDAEGNLAGIEILDVLKWLERKDIFKQVILEDVALAQ
jgi:uncharacterized protein YuzE